MYALLGNHADHRDMRRLDAFAGPGVVSGVATPINLSRP